MIGFQGLGSPLRTVDVELDGVPFRFHADRSLLANILLFSPGSIAFVCAIGHCQRCVVAVNGEKLLACRSYPQGGERIETGAIIRGTA
jgi:hypothetical protein